MKRLLLKLTILYLSIAGVMYLQALITEIKIGEFCFYLDAVAGILVSLFIIIWVEKNRRMKTEK